MSKAESKRSSVGATPSVSDLQRLQETPKSAKQLVPIYTDWANHYLEKGQKSRLIVDLPKDLQDSLMLVDVVESVTGEKVPDVKLKPKTTVQTVENISACLTFLEQLGVNVDGVTAKDIRDGQLKAILGLFFSLSRYKQQQKSANSNRSNNNSIPTAMASVKSATDTEVISKLPTTHKGLNSNGHIPSGLPQAQTKRPATDSKDVVVGPKSGLKAPEVSVKRSGLPPPSNSSTRIPAGSNAVGSNNVAAKLSNGATPATISNGSLKPPGSKLPAPKLAASNNNFGAAPTTRNLISQTQSKTASTNSLSGSTVPSAIPARDPTMLEKFRLFGSKPEKNPTGTVGTGSPRLSKSSTRASNSSSGFSSARSELSDYDSIPPTSAATGNCSQQPPLMKESSSKESGGMGSPKAAFKAAFSKKNFTKSPKLSKKDISAPTTTDIETPSKPISSGGGLQPPSARKISGCAQTSPRLMRKPTGSGRESEWAGQLNRASKTSERSDDGDSAYAGCDSSPTSSGAPSESRLYVPPLTRDHRSHSSEYRDSDGSGNSPMSPVNGAKSIPKPMCAVKGTKQFPTVANKTVTVGSAALAPSGATVSSSRNSAKSSAAGMNQPMTKPSSLAVRNGEGDGPSSSNDSYEGASKQAAPGDTSTKFVENYKAVRSYSSAGLQTKAASPVTVGVVSPMTQRLNREMMQKTLEANATGTSTGGQTSTRSSNVVDLNSSFDSLGGHQSDSNSSHTSNSGNQSDTHSVIFCPSGDESAKQPGGLGLSRKAKSTLNETSTVGIKMTAGANVKAKPAGEGRLSDSTATGDKVVVPPRSSSRLETTFDSSDGVVTQTVCAMSEDAKMIVKGGDSINDESDIVPMKPLAHRTSPYSYLRSLGGLNKNLGSNIKLTSENVQPGRKPHLALSNRPTGSPSMMAAQQAAMEASRMDSTMKSTMRTPLDEIPIGYTSDMEVIGAMGANLDLEISGYMSEGGISLYARKLQARFKEGMEAVRDSLKKPTDIIDDSYEDSSSVSSGISENFDEISTDDLTGSSLSDQAFKPSTGGVTIRSAPQSLKSGRIPAGKFPKTTGSSEKSNAGQQTEGVGLRKTPAQFNQESIDQLLQKSRSQSRGIGSGLPINTSLQRPKSEQMNGATTLSIRQFTHEGDPLRLRANMTVNSQLITRRTANSGVGTNGVGSFNMEPIYSNYQQRNPLMYAVSDSQVPQHLISQQQCDRRGDSSVDQLQRPLSATGHRVQQGMTSMSGYHSLDRKKHLFAQYTTTNGPQNAEDSEAEGGALSYRSDSGIRPSNGASLNLYLSSGKKRDSPPLSLPPAASNLSITESWMRHSVGGSNMSRSLIDQQEMKVSPSSEYGTNGNRSMNTSQRLSMPRENLMNGCRPTAGQTAIPFTNGQQSPRSGRSATGKNGTYEPSYVNFTPSNGQRLGKTQDLSPTSQMQLQKLSSSAMSTQSEPGMSPTSRSAPAGRSTAMGPTYASPYLCNMLSKVGLTEEEVHGSSLSLASSVSSLYSTADEKNQAEIRRLHREVENYKDKVQQLTNHQCTYAHVVKAFEQSLNSMKNRISTLQSTAEQKDTELEDLKDKFDTLRQFSATAGINVDHVFSPNLQRRHTFNQKESNLLSRQGSRESLNSVNSGISQKSSVGGLNGFDDKMKGDKKGGIKKGWLRSSFTKAFTRGKKNKNGSVSDVEEPNGPSNPSSPCNTPRHSQHLKPSNSSSALNTVGPDDVVTVLQNKINEKDSALTDIRLEALTSAQQVEQLREAINKLQTENVNLRHHNERLRAVVTHSSRAGSQNSLPILGPADDNESVSDGGNVLSEMSVPTAFMLSDGHEGHLIQVAVNLGFHGNLSKFLNDPTSSNGEVLIGSVRVSNNLKWDVMDSIVAKLFKEYVLRIDPVSNLSLSADSIVGYTVGSIMRMREKSPPVESLPSCFSPNITTVNLTLKGVQQASVDAISFETLVPKAEIQKYIGLLMEHRRMILCGSCGTGKSYLAHKLGEYLVLKNEKTISPGSIATFSVESSSARDLSQYLATIASQCEQVNGTEEIPSVIILDNLHNVRSLAEVFNGFLSSRHHKCPYIIGTMNQHNGSTTTLQLHHNFRWIIMGNHIDPVRGFLGRYLRRRLIEGEVKQNAKYPACLQQICDWLPKVWTRLNKFIEDISSSDVTIGPRLFLSCPIDVEKSREWFVELWNYSIIPYLIEAGREGLQLYGKRLSWEDPTEYVITSWPWISGEDPDTSLLRVRPEDLGYSTNPPSLQLPPSVRNGDTDEDQLLSMLIRLKQTTANPSDSAWRTPKAQNTGVESTL